MWGLWEGSEGKGWLPPTVVGSTISWNTLNSSPQFQEAFQTNPRKSLRIPYHYSQNTGCSVTPSSLSFRESLQERFYIDANAMTWCRDNFTFQHCPFLRCIMEYYFDKESAGYKSLESISTLLLYPARSQWGTYRGCCSRRDEARTSG